MHLIFCFITDQIILSPYIMLLRSFSLRRKIWVYPYSIQHHHFRDSRLHLPLLWLKFLRVSFEMMIGLVFKSALLGNSDSGFHNSSGICFIFQPTFFCFIALFGHRTTEIHTWFTPSTKVNRNVYISQFTVVSFKYVERADSDMD